MKTAVVTGGGSGIGLAVAQRLRADGLDVATIDLRPSDSDLSFTADVTDRSQVDAALSAIRAQLGPVTVLVNAAGLDGFKRFSNITFEDWQRVIDVNLNGVFHTHSGGAARHGRGRVGTDRQYLLVEHALRRSLHESLRGGQVRGQRAHQIAGTRVRARGITVNAVPPGFIDTPMLRAAEKNGFLGDIEENIARTPVRRMGKPEDIAAACAFLVSEEAGYITGQILGVNGGRNT